MNNFLHNHNKNKESCWSSNTIFKIPGSEGSIKTKFQLNENSCNRQFLDKNTKSENNFILSSFDNDKFNYALSDKSNSLIKINNYLKSDEKQHQYLKNKRNNSIKGFSNTNQPKNKNDVKKACFKEINEEKRNTKHSWSEPEHFL